MTHQVKALLSVYRNNWKIRSGAVLLVLAAWVYILSMGDSLLVTSLFLALGGLMAFVKNTRQRICPSAEEKKWGLIFSAAFALAAVMANYRVYTPFGAFFYRAFILFAGGMLISWHILLVVSRAGIRKTVPGGTGRYPAAKWFLFVFLGISAIDLLALFFCYRPGLLTPDSISQIRQNLDGVWSNHHPFWHTMIIRMVMNPGMDIFGDINSAVTVYSVFQILCMAAVFAYVCMTLYESGVPRGWVRAAAMIYGLIPYHMLYSFTMWKDVLFAGCVALFVCAMYRVMKGIGKKPAGFTVLTAGGLGCCLLRSNGLAAFALTFILLAFIIKKSGKTILLIMLAVMAAAFVLKHPVLKLLKVDQPDTVEFLSIPEQQIARLIADGEELEPEELRQIERIMDPETVREEYDPDISDPVKEIIRKTGSDELNENKWEYLMLWLKLGLKHPGTYLNAWIDSTKGYWNGGYNYWVVATGVHENDLGIEAVPWDNIIGAAVNGWSYLFFFGFPVFQIFTSIGLHVWLVILIAVVSVIRKRKEGLLCILPLAVIASLLISTPVFSEFRYAYAVFTTLPLIALAGLTGATATHRKEPFHG